MRYRLMASYQGSPFEAGIGPSDGDIVLFAACPPPEELGFEPATGHWRKQLGLDDVQAVWESRPVGTFRGERCMVLDDLGDRLHIGYLGHDGFKAEQLGYWQVDRGVFELVAPRTDVTDISEERTEHRRQVTAPHPVLAPEPATGPWPLTGPLTSADPATGRQPVAQLPAPASEPAAAYLPSSASLPVPDSSTGVALPLAAPAPLPLEAEAMRAASAARRPRPAAGSGGDAAPQESAGLSAADPAAAMTSVAHPAAAALAELSLITDSPLTASPATTTQVSHDTGAHTATASPADGTTIAADATNPGAPVTAPPAARPRRAARRRMATERLFGDLASLAGIPADSYAVGEDVEGALCLVQTLHGFEVFHCAGGARHELQVFATEESACFYLFGVLAAEAVRNGSLARVPASLGTGQA